MKRLLNLLHNLLRRGCLRIFPKPHFCVLLSLSLLTVYSCSTSRHVSGLVEHTSTDTLSLSQVQYDSIYRMLFHSNGNLGIIEQWRRHPNGYISLFACGFDVGKQSSVISAAMILVRHAHIRII